MASCLRASLVLLPLLAFTTACVDTGNLFGGGGSGPSGGGPSTGGSPETGGNPPTTGGAPETGGGPNGGSPSTGGANEGGAPPTCGDGDIDAQEECDGLDLGGQDCTSLGYVEPGGLACNESCQLDATDCKADCGNGETEPGEDCDDGNQQPNDGCSTSCTVELGSCTSPEPVALALGTTVVSGTTGGASAMAPTNGQNCQGAAGPEMVFEVTPAVTGYLTAYLPSQGTGMDSVLYAQTGCGALSMQRLCHDNFGTPGNDGGELLSFKVEGGVPILIVVDGYQSGDSGAFDLSLDLSDGDTCADPVPLTLEGDADIVVLGNTMGETSNGASNAFCGNSGAGPDIVYEVTMVQGDNYTFDMIPNGFNSVIHARTDCADINSQTACDSPVTSNDSGITIDVDNGTTEFIYADGTTNNSGAYQIQITH